MVAVHAGFDNVRVLAPHETGYYQSLISNRYATDFLFRVGVVTMGEKGFDV